MMLNILELFLPASALRKNLSFQNIVKLTVLEKAGKRCGRLVAQCALHVDTEASSLEAHFQK